ncbi:MAG: methyltransferase [Polyangiaceae bacterium]|nr:methyltransferase [Polyangiaceae bacterium]
MATARIRLERVLAALLPSTDIVEERVIDVEPPAWCERRQWTGFLLGLDEAALGACEADGLAAHLPSLPGAPADLVALGQEVTKACRLPVIDGQQVVLPERLRAVPRRKQAQLSALLGAMRPLAMRAERIVDVGSGSGHLTRLSAEIFGRRTLGLERDASRVAVAVRRLAAEPYPQLATRYLTVDADRDALLLDRSDLAVGLHACGALGDRLVEAVGDAGCDLALVSCCLQKRSEPVRLPLARAARSLVLRRDVLGLTNLTAQPMGVEARIETTMRAREARYALGRLLATRGVACEPGAEMHGINRRRAAAGLEAIARRALALRGLSPPTALELRDHEREARTRYAVVRRLSLPRSMLARLVETAVSLDRGAYLEERDHQVVVATIFERAVTPRNVAVFASRSLPALVP